jgi:hypothetical protein
MKYSRLTGERVLFAATTQVMHAIKLDSYSGSANCRVDLLWSEREQSGCKWELSFAQVLFLHFYSD